MIRFLEGLLFETVSTLLLYCFKVKSFGDVGYFIFVQKDIFLANLYLQVVSQLAELTPRPSFLRHFSVLSPLTINRVSCFLLAIFDSYVLFIIFG